MSTAAPPVQIENLIGGRSCPAADGRVLEKRSPATGEVISHLARSGAGDAAAAITAAKAAQPGWAAETPVARGTLLRRVAQLLERDADRIAQIVAAETGKSPADAAGETQGAIEMGYFVAGEGRRFYGRTTTSGVPHRHASIVRQPVGVAGLIIAANTPIANVAWKAFPALMGGNGAVLKASEDTPQTAAAFAELVVEAGAPDGIFNVVHGLGPEVGEAIVTSPDVDLVSFTGSTGVGRMIARTAGERLAKVCLELGGKNPLIVCDDADLAGAARTAALSAFSNAGQRCAAGSRIIVFDAVYDEFRDLLLAEARAQRVGSSDGDDYGPVINERQCTRMLAAVDRARAAGATILHGGERIGDRGWYVAPTLIEDAPVDAEVCTAELFGPIATLHRVGGFEEALSLANATSYGLTAAIWTRSVHRAQEFVARVRSGVASVNGPTYGSEPHWPFGGLGASGTGWREAGTEAMDVYTELKTVHITHDPAQV
ncbi:aldehyde dehydrogenase family protein [Svornostia abyssi]|uniref:Aldehyde dehydrogenase family protein n=1 Tax=Svornostia abyssi TaxID=2898438 RepID=A0ABY5PMC0_9ACTN|nr:aldehyde dehydrogenase family protein [Parviterribacteraceae bacterium J379]